MLHSLQKLGILRMNLKPETRNLKQERTEQTEQQLANTSFSVPSVPSCSNYPRFLTAMPDTHLCSCIDPCPSMPNRCPPLAQIPLLISPLRSPRLKPSA